MGCTRETRVGDASTRRVLRVAQESDAFCLDPQRLNETTTLSVLENIFESLVTQDSNLKVMPALAAGWETPDERTWRVHLRRGVMFHDGREMNSTDVKFSYDRVLASSDSGFRNALNSVESVAVVDPYTVDVKLKEPYGVVANLGSIYILPADYIQGKGEAFFAEHPIGTGPYRFIEWERGESLRMAAFEDYWRGRRADFDQMVFYPITSAEERLRKLEREEIDIAAQIPFRREPPVNYRTFSEPALHVFYIGFDVTRPKTPHADTPGNPFRDPRVRHAFLYGIDTGALLDDVFGGRGYVATQLVTPSIFGFNPAIKGPRYDLARATELLAEAGYPAGFGAALTLQFPRRQVGQFLQQALSKLNVRLSLDLVSKEEFYRKLDTQDASMYLLGWSCTSGDASELFEYVVHAPDAERRLGIRNVFGYSNPRVDEMFETSIRTVDSKERLKLLQDAMVLVMDDLPWMPLYITESIYGVSTKVAWTPRLDDHILGYDAHPHE
ncbi:MAG: ABC transporter substrate-binding protein [Acidobacteriota bacterium]